MYVQPGYLFRRAHQLATAAFNAVTRDDDITPVQMASLVSIKDNAGIDATRLSDMIRFDRTTIGHVIGRLEQKGLIERAEGSVDKRTKTLHITKKGAQLVDRLSEKTPDISDLILAPLTEKERGDLLKILQKLDKYASSTSQLASLKTSD
jgi:DNA-binding MarR family transcriptional regulator